ncbi:277_t:CDS:10 [Entrophospora sp. SA101]|nr:277_t:CDS:10 [Entrophospora sp. SA101]
MFVHNLLKNFRKKDFSKLSNGQLKIFDLIVNEGLNVFYTGIKGTGKRFLLRQLIKALVEKYETKNVAVTSTTDISAIEICGETLDSFVGVNFQKDKLKLLKRIQNISIQRLQETKVLIIDEISMLDGRLFDELEIVARMIRRNNKPFGGIQLVLLGDFWQSSIKKQRISKYCFEAESWRCLNYCIRLTKTYENKDPKLTRVLNDIRDETLSHKTNNIIKNLQKTPKYPNDDIKIVVKLRMIQNKLYEYTAVDNVLGDDNDRHIKCFVENENFFAKKQLKLMRGAQVMLIKNLKEPELVSGRKGVILGFYSIKDQMSCYNGEDLYTKPDDELLPIVKFTNGIEKIIYPEKWTIQDIQGNVLASRHQLPLIPSWAIDIHNSRGQIFERIIMDLKKITERGEIYSVLSRIKSFDYVQILHFKRQRLYSDEKLQKFHASLNILADS